MSIDGGMEKSMGKNKSIEEIYQGLDETIKLLVGQINIQKKTLTLPAPFDKWFAPIERWIEERVSTPPLPDSSRS